MRILNLMLLFLSLNLAAQEELSKEKVAKFHEEMLLKANELETLEADFIQTKKIEMITEESVSRGKLYYQNPDKIKWKYAVPQNYVILFIGGELHIDDAGDKSVRNTSSNKLFDKVAKLITGSVNGKLLQDNQNFYISLTSENELVSALVIPKDENLKAMFAEIHLRFNEENIIEQVDLKEEVGDITTIEFSNIKINQDVPATVFEP